MPTEMADPKLANRSLYEEDFYAWTEEQSGLLRAGDLTALDREHLAEEIENMGGRDCREVQRRLEVLIQHLLKWRYQPERQTRSWRSTIWTQRRDLTRILRDNPSLRSRLPEWLPDAYEGGYEAAREETGLYHLPQACPFTLAEILDRDWYPDAA